MVWHVSPPSSSDGASIFLSIQFTSRTSLVQFSWKIQLQFSSGGCLLSVRSRRNNLEVYLLYVKTCNKSSFQPFLFFFTDALYSNSFLEFYCAISCFLLVSLTCSFIVQLQNFYLYFSSAAIFLILFVIINLYISYSLLSL